MEIAELILKYFEVLIWPALIIWFTTKFSIHLKLLLQRLVKGNEFEFTIGGNQLKVKVLDELVNEFEEISFKKEKTPDSVPSDVFRSKVREITALAQLPDRALIELIDIGRVGMKLGLSNSILKDLELVYSYLSSDGLYFRLTDIGEGIFKIANFEKNLEKKCIAEEQASYGI